MKGLIGLGLLSVVTAVFGVSAPSYFVAGGGYRPLASQAVLEKNVLLFREVLKSKAVNPAAMRTLFAGGKGVDDVFQLDGEIPKDEVLFSELFSRSDSPACFLRPNTLEDVQGSLVRVELDKKLEEAADDIKPGTGFNFYFTGHGHGSSYDGFSKNYLALWGEDEYTVQDYAKKLDRFDPRTPSQTVMVQCFSGGFAQINYKEGEKKGTLAPHDRCGFFAQIPSRPAAGCSPDLEQREEYSPYFFAAYWGKTEKGAPANADYNGDGQVTSEEAHAYVILHENAGDIPVTTSSELLRDQDFKLDKKFSEMTLADFAKLLATKPAAEAKVEGAIIHGLAQRLEPEATEGPILIALRKAILKSNQGTSAALQEYFAARSAASNAKRKVYAELVKDHEVLKGDYRAEVKRGIVTTEAISKARLAYLMSESVDEYRQTSQAMDVAMHKYFDIMHRTAKVERLQYLLMTLAYETALADEGREEVQQKYAALKKCESRSFFEN